MIIIIIIIGMHVEGVKLIGIPHSPPVAIQRILLDRIASHLVTLRFSKFR